MLCHCHWQPENLRAALGVQLSGEAGNEAQRLSGLETKIAYFEGILTTGTSHIRLGLIDETSVERPASSPCYYDLPIHGIPPWDAYETWKKSFVGAWNRDRARGSLSTRLGKVSLLEGSQRPESIVALGGSGLDETRYVIRLEDPKATLEMIVVCRPDMERCIREAGESWRADLAGAHLLLVQAQEQLVAERERICQTNRSGR